MKILRDPQPGEAAPEMEARPFFYHQAYSVKALQGLKNHQLKQLFGPDDKGKFTAPEVRAYLGRLRKAGALLLPGSPCDNFYDQTGCQGHEVNETNTPKI